MSLKCEGGFVTRIMFSYADDVGETQLTRQGGDITLGLTQTADPGDFDVPNGARIRMYVFVAWGNDNQARQAFIYDRGNPATADYVISGTTLNNELGLIGVHGAK